MEHLVEVHCGRGAGAAASIVDGGREGSLEADVGGVHNSQRGHLDGDQDGGGLAFGGGARVIGDGEALVLHLPLCEARGEAFDNGVGGEAVEALLPGHSLKKRRGHLAEERGALEVVRLQVAPEVFGEGRDDGAGVGCEGRGGEGRAYRGPDEIGHFVVQLRVVQPQVHGPGGAGGDAHVAGAADAVEHTGGLLGEDGDGGRPRARRGSEELRVEQLAPVEAQRAGRGRGHVEAREERTVLEDVLDVDADGEGHGDAKRLGEVEGLVGVGGVCDFDLGKDVVELELG